MAVANGQTILKSMSFISSETGTDGTDTSSLIWTLDGEWAVDIDYAVPNDIDDSSDIDNGPQRKLIAIRKDGKLVKEFPCAGCAQLAAIGGSKVVVGVDRQFEQLPSQGSPFPGHDVPLEMVDLNSSSPPVLTHSKLLFLPGTDSNPVYNSDGSIETYSYNFIASMPGQVVALQYAALSTITPENLVLLRSDGTTKNLGSTHSSLPVTTSADVAGTIGGKQSVVFDGGWDQSVPDEGSGHIAVLDPATGMLTHPDTSAMFPATEMPSSTVSAGATDLWWGSDDKLYGLFSVASSTNDNGGPVTQVVPDSLWRLDGMRWTKVMNEQLNGSDVIKLRMFRDGSRAMTVNDSGLQTDNGYTLYFEPKGRPTMKVASDVTSLVEPGA